MTYRTRSDLRMWDTWMLKVGDVYHLFTLTQPYHKPAWDRVCHAVSKDLIHWEDWDDIVLEDEQNRDAWDAGVILTGSTFECEQGYGMTYGAVKEGEEVQRIGLAFSKDLRRWEKYPGNPVLVPREPFYETCPRETTESSVAWRDAYVLRTDAGYEAFIAANDAAKPKTINACVARVTSGDLVHWEYHPPMVSPERYVDMEVPQYFELNGFHYLLFCSGGKYDLPSRVATTGTYYLIAGSKYGDYRIPDDNMLIGSGDFRADCYVGKVIASDEGMLLYHHIAGYRTAFAAPKALCQDAEGTLWLERWEGLGQLLGEPILDSTTHGAVATANHGITVGQWRHQEPNLMGEAGPAISGWLFEPRVEDCRIHTTVDLGQAGRAGILFRMSSGKEPDSPARGMALCLNQRRGVIQLCEAQLGGRRSVELRPLDTVYRRPRERCEMEVFLRAQYAEVYVDRRPLFALNMDPGGPGYESMSYPMSGRTGCFAGEGTAAFLNYEVKNLCEEMR